MNYNMECVKNMFSGDNKYNIAGISIVTMFLILAALYVYKKSISSKIKDNYAPNQEFLSNKGSAQSATLYYFYTTWCPHCKKTMPIWDELFSELNDTELNGVTLSLIKVDCDKEQSLAESFNVQGYPTVKLVYGGKTIEYDAKIDKSTMMEFLNSSL
jgi:thiol-disulfide isomerase/thioredoxin